MKIDETKNPMMIDATQSSHRQRMLPSVVEDDTKTMMSPATAALEKFSGLPQRERRNCRKHLLSIDAWSDCELETKRNHVFDMTDLFNVSLPIEGTMEFPPISWANEEVESRQAFASKRSTSYADGWLARPKSSLVLSRCSSTTSLLNSSFGKRHRRLNVRSSKRLVRSIAMNSDLSTLETSSILRLDHDACVVASNYDDQNFYPSKLDNQSRPSVTIKLNECLKILKNSELCSSRHFSKKPRGGQQA